MKQGLPVSWWLCCCNYTFIAHVGVSAGAEETCGFSRSMALLIRQKPLIQQHKPFQSMTHTTHSYDH